MGFNLGFKGLMMLGRLQYIQHSL